MKQITLATLPQATAQEVFDQVATHLLTQNERSTDPKLTGVVPCAYRGEEGLRCAAGCLIGDDEYLPSMEGNMWRTMMCSGIVPEAHFELITELQRVHDVGPVREWSARLAKVADDFGLDDKVLNTSP